MARHDLKSRRRHPRGIASLEFVIVLPVLLLLVFGVVEYGWLFTKAAQLNNAARDGARVGAREGATTGDIADAVAARLTESGITGATVNITNTSTTGDPVTVEIVAPYTGSLQLTSYTFLPVPEQLRAQVTMRKEGP